MEATISAILGELASRSMSFLVDTYLKRTSAQTEECVNSLQRLLLQVRVIVEEAEERRITNQAMLHQLSILRMEMYRGYYTLDTCICRGDDQVSSHAFTLSKYNPAKRVCFYGGSSSQSVKELQRVLGSLEAIVSDVKELVVFLGSCPRLCRQPYSMYLILDKCMFGRQVEMERVINFLLQPAESQGIQEPGVLPIIGRARAGKSTLVEHTCNDERVRAHFSQIVFFTQGDLEDGSLQETLRDGGEVRYRNRGMALDNAGRVLIVAELGGGRYSKRLEENIDEGLLGRLYKIRIASGSKIIVTSRSDKIASFGGTEPPLKLEFLTQEAYWYLFKAYAFGSTDTADHPKLTSIAMDMCRECGGCFLAANIFPRLLRSNPCPRFASSVLAALKGLKRNHYLYTAAAGHQEAEVCNPGSATPSFVVLDDYETPDSVHGSAAPCRLSLRDVLFGSARPRGIFDALAWKSQIPPHYSYIYSGEIRRPKRKIVRNKRIGG